MGKILNDPNLTLQIMATGMHLSNKFGDTIEEIQSDGFTEYLRSKHTSETAVYRIKVSQLGHPKVQ